MSRTCAWIIDLAREAASLAVIAAIAAVGLFLASGSLTSP